MGAHGYAFVTITTKADFESQAVSKEIKLGDWRGLDGLILDWDFDKSFSDEVGSIYIKNILFRDLSMLPDGTYKIGKKERPENFLADKYYDYVWIPLGDDYEF